MAINQGNVNVEEICATTDAALDLARAGNNLVATSIEMAKESNRRGVIRAINSGFISGFNRGRNFAVSNAASNTVQNNDNNNSNARGNSMTNNTTVSGRIGIVMKNGKPFGITIEMDPATRSSTTGKRSDNRSGKRSGRSTGTNKVFNGIKASWKPTGNRKKDPEIGYGITLSMLTAMNNCMMNGDNASKFARCVRMIQGDATGTIPNAIVFNGLLGTVTYYMGKYYRMHKDTISRSTIILAMKYIAIARILELTKYSKFITRTKTGRVMKMTGQIWHIHKNPTY
jgi:hypothetical protein